MKSIRNTATTIRSIRTRAHAGRKIKDAKEKGIGQAESAL
jgi:hypothetical protein